MQPPKLYLIHLFVSVSSVLATPWHPVIRTDLDVFAPEFTAPGDGDAWTVGKRYTVTWKTDVLPENITSVDDTIKLRTKGTTLPVILAAGLDLLAGKTEVVAPWVETGDYQLVFLGEHGEVSPTFTIVT